ncbi:MAG: HlyD family efflux transporter periplasmic adaptor subunit [Lachnospiraceae bacterium]|nr:HlyD family efflux transporter periplasmic adaptor subunit [Lachnospiraceae bacterium]
MKEKIRKHKKLCIILLIVLLLAIFLASCVSRVKKAQQELIAAMNQPQIAQVERRTLVSTVSATGKVDSAESKEISVGLNGVEIKSIAVQVGDVIEAGTLLCEFDSEDIEKNLADARASLNASSARTQMDITSAQRSLAEAEATRNIELERADADLAKAWNDYLKALTDQEEAKEEWDNAKQTTIEKKGEYEYRQELLTAAGQSGANGQSEKLAKEFEQTKKELESYIASQSVGIGSGVMDRIYITSDDLAGITVGSDTTSDIVIDANQNPDKAEQVNAYLGTLKSYQTQYQAAKTAETNYASLQQEVASWQTKYNTAKQVESGAEAAYEQAVSAAEAKLELYNNKVRAKEDTQRNQDTSVQNKTDSLTTSKLNATTSTLSDEQKVKTYQEQLENCVLKAPISGVITAVNAKAGDTYNGGALFTIEDVSAYEVSAEIDEYDIGKIREGQTVVIKTNGTGDEELKGTVQQVAPRATAKTTTASSSSEVTYNVRISIDTANDLLKLDMTAKLSIIQDSKENVLTVPYEAIHEDESGNYYVEVVESVNTNADIQVQPEEGANNADEQNGQPQNDMAQSQEEQPEGRGRDGNNSGGTDLNTRRVYVKKGIESDYYIEVISNEITEGMEVVVPRNGQDGMDIQMMMQNRGPMGGF